jgi:putative peptide zinc metalloprotease protein
LFRTLEAVDGQRNVDEIAAAVTTRTDWALTAEQVEYLIDKKLVPLGLIASTGDEADAGANATRSALMLQAPIPLLRERAIESIARVTKHLFDTHVVIGLLSLVALGHLWLYFTHGIQNGLLEVLYAPGLLVAVLGLIGIAGLVHEFGHASGLRHGGRRARSIGAGLYLVYPAFFTDVSESYALPRKARLRTDLGGIYFHLLFGLLLIGLFQLTGWEVLLFTVVLIDIEVLRQLLPFGRLDGYWILADLTGIPDPLSQMLPFLRGTVDKAGLEGSRLPALRHWVRRAFIAYIALTIPAVAVFLVILLARLPTLLGLVWDALTVQVSLLATAAENSAPMMVVLAGLQIGLLCLEVVATAFILAKIARQGVVGIARLGQAGGSRRAAAFALALAVVGGLTFLWAPHISGLAAGGVAGVQYVDVTSRNHVEGTVAYGRVPPVGGDHSPVWENCGFYSTAVPTERAVHSMEHGAVWITYQPGLPKADLEHLRELANGRSHILVTAFPQNPAPLVATAWGRQLLLERVDDPRLDQFIVAFRLGSNAPERGGLCEGGEGQPEGK